MHERKEAYVFPRDEENEPTWRSGQALNYCDDNAHIKMCYVAKLEIKNDP